MDNKKNGFWRNKDYEMSTEARTALYVQSIYIKIQTASNVFLCKQSTMGEKTVGDFFSALIDEATEHFFMSQSNSFLSCLKLFHPLV